MKIEFGEIFRDDKRNFRTPAILRIYIDDERKGGTEARPFEKGDIIGDFAWRRQISYKDVAKDPDFRNQTLDFMKKLEFPRQMNSYHFGFSRYAGCDSCPCSPGIVVQYPDYSGLNHSFNVWVTLRD